jgi:hypothetical protein
MTLAARRFEVKELLAWLVEEFWPNFNLGSCITHGGADCGWIMTGNSISPEKRPALR